MSIAGVTIAGAEGLEHRQGAGSRTPGRPRRRARPRLRRLWAALAAAAVLLSVLHVCLGHGLPVHRGGLGLLGSFLGAALHPETGPDFLRLTGAAALTTLALAVLGTALGLVIGAVGGVLASELWWLPAGRPGRRAGRLLVRAGLSLPRGVHEVVWGLLLAGFLGADPVVAVLAIGIPQGAVTAKVFSDLLDETPRSAFAALRSAGSGRLAALAYAALPISAPDLISHAFYRLECSIRVAAILGFIGAGGLGFQLALSFQSLRYGEMWTLIYALVGLGAAVELWSALIRRRLRRSRRDRVLGASAVAAAALVAGAWWYAAPDAGRLWAAGSWRLFAQLARESWPPALSADRLGTLGSLALETVEMSLVALAVALPVSLAVAFAAARLPDRRRGGLLLPAASRAGLLVARSLPPPVWALVLLFVLVPGPLAGAVALGGYTAGVLGRLLAEVLENTDPAPARALTVQGATPRQATLVGLLPAAASRLAALSLYRWEVTVRETVVVGIVGAGGLGRLLGEQLAGFDRRGMLATVMALMLITAAADLAGSAGRRALR